MSSFFSHVPSWFGGCSLLLALTIFYRDREAAKRKQVEQLGVWADPDIPPDLPIGLEFDLYLRNTSNLPMRIDVVVVEASIEWLIASSKEAPPTSAARGREPSISPFILIGLVRPDATHESRQSVFVLNQAPEGSVQIRFAEILIRAVDVTDNAGRRWAIRPTGRRVIRRVRWYHFFGDEYNIAHPWHKPEHNYLTTPVRVIKHPIKTVTGIVQTRKIKRPAPPPAAEYIEFHREDREAVDRYDREQQEKAARNEKNRDVDK